MGRRSIPISGQGDIGVTGTRGRYVARVRWRTSDGAYHETTAAGSSKEEARGACVERLNLQRAEFEAALQGPSMDEVVTMDDLAAMWIADLRADVGTERELSGSTINKYEGIWRGTLRHAFDGIALDDLTRQVAMKGLGSLIEHKRDGSGAVRLGADGQPVPVRGRNPWTVLSLMLDYAAETGLRVDADEVLPARRAKRRGRKAKVAKPLPRAVTTPEFKALLTGVRLFRETRRTRMHADLEDVLVCLWWLGPRINELLGLRVEDCHLDGDPGDPRPYVLIHDTLSDHGPGRRREHSGARKALGELRTILHPDAVEVLRRRIGTRHDPTALVFCTRTGGPLWDSNLRAHLAEVAHKGPADTQHPYRVDLPWLTFHSLRDTLATRMEKAHGIEAAAAALGNTVAVAAAHYVERPKVVEVDPTALVDDETPERDSTAPSAE